MIPEIYPLVLATIATTSLSVLVFRHNRAPCTSRPFFLTGNPDRSGNPPKSPLTERTVLSEITHHPAERKAAQGFVTVTIELNLPADDVVSEVQSSVDMIEWCPAFPMVSETPTGQGTVRMVVSSLAPVSENFFIRLAVRRR